MTPNRYENLKIAFDTCVINCLVDNDFLEPINEIISFKDKGVKIFVQYSIVREIEATDDLGRKNLLLGKLKDFEIAKEHLSILPFHLPAKLCTENDSKIYEELAKAIDGDKKDARVILDSMRSTGADVFVTVDKGIIKHKNTLKELGFIAMTPEECLNYLRAC